MKLAGDGKLKDNGTASAEFREFLSAAPPELLYQYANDCLTVKFEDGGFALQDIVNEIGQRLQFKVERGPYRGSSTQIGHDGLWRALTGDELIIEVKTTDAFRIRLNTIAKYRQRLIGDGHITAEHSSVLIVVGREDTGDLEAQIRGSRDAWDMRVISVDALLRLLRVIVESIESPKTARRVAGVLVPKEYTRVDGIVDLVFETAGQATQGQETESGGATEEVVDQPSNDGPPHAQFNKTLADLVGKHLASH